MSASLPMRERLRSLRKQADPTASPEAHPAKSESGSVSKRHEDEEDQIIRINRAPVLTLWATIVAMREGYAYPSALTFGRAISALFAQAKGRSIGVFEKREKTEEERRARQAEEEAAGVHKLHVFGRDLKAIDLNEVEGEPKQKPQQQSRGKSSLWSGRKTGPLPGSQEQLQLNDIGARLFSDSAPPRYPETIRALSLGSGSNPISAAETERYLLRSFGGREKLEAAADALQDLALSISRGEIGSKAYGLYEQFRPSVQAGLRGWGQKGKLDLGLVRRLG
ncbi:hypothetical protein HK102_005885 [Quaeritorhiza haematococci]|nr:hypothetical protein HK102_005885 [Quaeritorhiza haematococci]